MQQISDMIQTVQNVILFRVLPILALILLSLVIYSVLRWREKNKNQLKKAKEGKVKGIVFGKRFLKLVYSPTEKEGHCVVFAGSGEGKTSAILIPTLRCWENTAFVIDISGDIEKNVEIQKVVYEPNNPSTHPYNIFGVIDVLETNVDKNQALTQLALLLLPDAKEMDGAEMYFTTGGRNILTASLIAFYNEGYDFVEICEKIAYSSYQELFRAIDKTGNQIAINYINPFQSGSEKNTSGCFDKCCRSIQLFSNNERVKRSVRRPRKDEKGITPALLEEESLFVLIEDNLLKLYAPLLQIITAQCLEFFSNRSNDAKKTILFCLDEFASFGRMDLLGAIRKLRKKKVRIMLLTQSMADFDLVYGKDERMAMLTNFAYKVVLGGIGDTESQEYFAKLIGYKKVKKYSKSRSYFNTTYSESEAKEWAIEPSELARLGNKLVLLHPDGYMVLKKNFFFKKRFRLKRRK